MGISISQDGYFPLLRDMSAAIARIILRDELVSKNGPVFVLILAALVFLFPPIASGQDDQNVQQAELVVRTGHSGPVSLVAYSPDGNLIASTGWDYTVRLWDSESHAELRSFQNGSQAYALAFSPDGRLLATGSGDGIIRIWDLDSGVKRFTADGNSGPVTALAFSPDGKWMVAGSVSGNVLFWDYLKELIGITPAHSGVIRSVAFSPNGRLIASATEDGIIKIWESKSRKAVNSWQGHLYAITSLAFSPDGKLLASASGKKLRTGFPSPDKSIKLWDVDSETLIRTIDRLATGVTSIGFSPDGRKLVSGGEHEDPVIRMWDTLTGKQIRTFEGHTSWVYSVAFSPDGKNVLSGGRDKTIRIWDAETGTETGRLTGQVLIRTLALSSSGDSIAFGTGDDTPGLSGSEIRHWDLKTNSLKLLQRRPDAIVELSRALQKDLLAVASWDSSIQVIDFKSGEEVFSRKMGSRALSAALSPDGRLLAGADLDGSMVVFDIGSGRQVKFPGWSATGRRLAFSPDGGLLASSDTSGAIRLFDLSGKQAVMVLETGPENILSVAFSPDGKFLANGGLEGTVKLWDLSVGTEKWRVKPVSAQIWSVDFSLDGTLLATGDQGGSVRLWKLASGEQIKVLEGHSGKVTDVSFSPDQKHIFSAGADGTIRIWEMETGDQVAALVPLGAKDWAVVTPEGLFDASPNGRNLIHYAVGIEPVTLEQMKDAYYVPGLLQKVLGGEPLPDVSLFSSSDLFPLAEYEQPKPGETTFPVKLKNRGGGIGPVQVIVNGKELLADARPEGFDPGSPELDLKIDLKDAPLRPGLENLVEVVARNREGSLSSRGSSRGVGVKVSGAGKAGSEPPNIYAIVAGISNYTGDYLDLRFAAKDAERFAKAVELGAVNLLGDSSRVHIRLLTDRGDQAQPGFTIVDARTMRATKKDLEQAFADFSQAGPNDVFIVYLAGHGVSINKGSGTNEIGRDTYLYLTQEATTNDRSVLSIEGVGQAMSLSSDELNTWMKANKALKQVLVLDTCAAGAVTNSLVAKRDLPSDQIRAIERLKDNTGFYVLMGSAADAVSYEANQYGQGLLTYSLLQGMKGARLREGQFADVSLLFNYAQDTVPQLARNIGGVQRPLVITPDSSGTFDIGRFTDREQRGIALASIKPLVLRPSLQNENELIDTLGLTPLLRRELRELSFRGSAGEPDAPIVFVEADEMVDAIAPTGRYTIDGKTVTVRVVLSKNGERVGEEIRITGIIEEKEALVRRLAVLIAERLSAASASAAMLRRVESNISSLKRPNRSPLSVSSY